jgi:hypothetical protein
MEHGRCWKEKRRDTAGIERDDVLYQQRAECIEKGRTAMVADEGEVEGERPCDRNSENVKQHSNDTH